MQSINKKWNYYWKLKRQASYEACLFMHFGVSAISYLDTISLVL